MGRLQRCSDCVMCKYVMPFGVNLVVHTWLPLQQLAESAWLPSRLASQALLQPALAPVESVGPAISAGPKEAI